MTSIREQDKSFETAPEAYLLPDCSRNRRGVPAETLSADRVGVLGLSTSHRGRGVREDKQEETIIMII